MTKINPCSVIFLPTCQISVPLLLLIVFSINFCCFVKFCHHFLSVVVSTSSRAHDKKLSLFLFLFNFLSIFWYSNRAPSNNTPIDTVYDIKWLTTSMTHGTKISEKESWSQGLVHNKYDLHTRWPKLRCVMCGCGSSVCSGLGWEAEGSQFKSWCK